MTITGYVGELIITVSDRVWDHDSDFNRQHFGAGVRWRVDIRFLCLVEG